MFDLNADWERIARSLTADPELAGRVESHRGLRVPGCWDGFELTTRAILGQQITVKAATALAGRLATAFGQPFAAGGGLTHLFPRPEALASADIASIGMPKARAETIRALARSVCDTGASNGARSNKKLRFDGIIDVDGFLARLSGIPGIGKWTAQYVAMRALGEPDAFPSSDLGLLRAVGLESPKALERRAESWRPWRAYAAMYLWSAVGSAGRTTGASVPGESAKALDAKQVSRQKLPISVGQFQDDRRARRDSLAGGGVLVGDVS